MGAAVHFYRCGGYLSDLDCFEAVYAVHKKGDHIQFWKKEMDVEMYQFSGVFSAENNCRLVKIKIKRKRVDVKKNERYNKK